MVGPARVLEACTLTNVRSVDLALPGAEIVATGIEDLRDGRETAEALLVSMAATRLRQLGFDVPPAIAEPEHRLWDKLAQEGVDAAHGRYNALVRRLVSFQRAACAG